MRSAAGKPILGWLLRGGPVATATPPGGEQYRAIRYTDRLADAGVVASVGSKGDSYDNAAAEAFNSLYKSELIHNKGPWVGVTDIEIATAEYLDWFNHRRLHGEIGHIPPAELENNYYAQTAASSAELATIGSLH